MHWDGATEKGFDMRTDILSEEIRGKTHVNMNYTIDIFVKLLFSILSWL